MNVQKCYDKSVSFNHNHDLTVSMVLMTNNSYRLFFCCLLFLFSLLPSCSNTGAAIMEREGCIHCHKFNEQGGNSGPDLTDVKHKRSEDWIIEKIRNPQKKNTGTKMPSYKHLSDDEISEIIAYLKR